jgi:hypothetical protein
MMQNTHTQNAQEAFERSPEKLQRIMKELKV